MGLLRNLVADGPQDPKFFEVRLSESGFLLGVIPVVVAMCPFKNLVSAVLLTTTTTTTTTAACPLLLCK